MSAEVRALIERFDHLRNSGVCSPTTRGLLDDAQALLSALSTPPADDVREAVAETVLSASPPYRLVATYEITDALLAEFEVRPRGTVTDAEVERAAKHLWVVAQDDENWARSVVDDVFSPADDWPEEALEAAEIARGVFEAAREARS